MNYSRIPYYRRHFFLFWKYIVHYILLAPGTNSFKSRSASVLVNFTRVNIVFKKTYKKLTIQVECGSGHAGAAITVWSTDRDFSVMGFIVDHLDMLITEWYPGKIKIIIFYVQQ